MRYIDQQDTPQCQWEGCYAPASTQVFTADGTDSAILCQFHRRVAQMNLEQYGTIRMPVTARRGDSLVRPGAEPPKPDVPIERPGKDNVPEWLREAADQADAAATPVESDDPGSQAPDKKVVTPRISNIPKPRMPS